MSHIYTSADQLIGRTPLLELTHLEKKYGLKARILAKLAKDFQSTPVPKVHLIELKDHTGLFIAAHLPPPHSGRGAHSREHWHEYPR